MKQLILVLSISVFFLSCKRDDQERDYRDAFVGKYFCNQTGSTMCNSQIVGYVDTSYIVSVEKVNDSLIKILNETLKIDIKGKFGGGYYPTPDYRFFEGAFRNDSIIFLTSAGGIACIFSSNFKGIKQ